MVVEELRASAVAKLIRAHRLIVVLRRVEPAERLLATVRELVGIGARIFEVTMDADDASGAIRAVRAAIPARRTDECLVGAGTIRSRDQLRVATRAGADFGVSPTFDREVLEDALGSGLPFLPGAYTPTEADTAWRAGATFVKLFPASSLGPAHVRELRGPLAEIEVVPTGGIDERNAAAFLEAGASAVGIGSALVKAQPAARRAIIAAVRSAP